MFKNESRSMSIRNERMKRGGVISIVEEAARHAYKYSSIKLLLCHHLNAEHILPSAEA